MAEPQDMIMPMLREMRAEIREEFRGFGSEMDRRFNKVDSRLDAIEAGRKSFRHALTADTMMSKFITGDFEERIALERQVGELMKRK
ncbi:MAG: hypothetical protein BroJett030_32710 [Alphaproteobacteria bacterium]|nr:MAG: hypothetical protein BroJett030_32710 [Alphaproteobacteria bacterium]